MFGKMVFTFPENALNLCIFNHTPSLPLKTPGKVSERKSVSTKTKGVEETMICFIKIQSLDLIINHISLFIFCMICTFSKCDSFTVLWNNAYQLVWLCYVMLCYVEFIYRR